MSAYTTPWRKCLPMSLAEMGACLGSFALVWRMFNGAWPSAAFLVILGLALAVVFLIPRFREMMGEARAEQKRASKPVGPIQKIRRRVGELAGNYGPNQRNLPSYYRSTSIKG
jgi:hypothetical protein